MTEQEEAAFRRVLGEWWKGRGNAMEYGNEPFIEDAARIAFAAGIEFAEKRQYARDSVRLSGEYSAGNKEAAT